MKFGEANWDSGMYSEAFDYYERAAEHYAAAAPGITMLEPASQACMRTAYLLYGGILDEVEAAGFDVFARRATVPNRRRAAVAVRSLLTRPGTAVAA